MLDMRDPDQLAYFSSEVLAQIPRKAAEHERYLLSRLHTGSLRESNIDMQMGAIVVELGQVHESQCDSMTNAALGLTDSGACRQKGVK